MSELELDLLRHQLVARDDRIRRLEGDLDAARAEHEELFEFAPVGYLTIGSSGVILEANVVAGSLLGAHRGDLVGRPIVSYISSEHASALERHFRSALAGDDTDVIEVAARDTSGGVRWLRLASLSVSEPGTAFSECRTVITDVTELRLAADARDREARMAAILAAVIDGAVRIDSSGAIVAFAHAAEVMFARSANDVIGRNVATLIAGQQERSRITYGPPPDAATSALRGTILLIEDEPASRETLSALLRSSGYAVLSAGDAREALARSRSSGCEVDVVLMDVMLPDARGPELANNLHGRCAGAPVVYMSGYTREHALREGVVPPDAPYIEKPIDVAQLERLLDRALHAS